MRKNATVFLSLFVYIHKKSTGLRKIFSLGRIQTVNKANMQEKMKNAKSFDQFFAAATVGALFVCHWHTSPFSKVCGFQRQILAYRLGRCSTLATGKQHPLAAFRRRKTVAGYVTSKSFHLRLLLSRGISLDFDLSFIRDLRAEVLRPSPGVPFQNI